MKHLKHQTRKPKSQTHQSSKVKPPKPQTRPAHLNKANSQNQKSHKKSCLIPTKSPSLHRKHQNTTQTKTQNAQTDNSNQFKRNAKPKQQIQQIPKPLAKTRQTRQITPKSCLITTPNNPIPTQKHQNQPKPKPQSI